MFLKKILKISTKLEQFYWDNHWIKGKVLYSTKTGQEKSDIKKFLLNPLPSEIAMWCDSLEGSDDEKALECLKKVVKEISYKTDEEQWGKPEYWQTPKETWELRTGDCDDMSIFLMKMLQACNILAFKRKIVLGLAKNFLGQMVGHAYLLYLTKEQKWTTLDASFFPEESIKNFGLPHSQIINYGTMWFTFNEENSWHQKSTIIMY